MNPGRESYIKNLYENDPDAQTYYPSLDPPQYNR